MPELPTIPKILSKSICKKAYSRKTFHEIKGFACVTFCDAMSFFVIEHFFQVLEVFVDGCFRRLHAWFLTPRYFGKKTIFYFKSGNS